MASGLIGKPLAEKQVTTLDVAPSTLTGSNMAPGVLDRVTTFTTGSYVLSSANCGLVLLNASGGNITLTTPSSVSQSAPPLWFKFIRIDGVPTNTVTVNRYGTDVYDGAYTSFTMNPLDSYSIESDLSTGYRTTVKPGGYPTGALQHFAQSRVPNGFLFCDGTAYSRTTYPNLFNVLNYSSTVTITISSPAVINWSGHTLRGNDPVMFTTTGMLPTGLNPSTTYWVVPSSIVAGVSFQVCGTAPGNTAVVTTGSQTGTQTCINSPWGYGDGSTTFNVPDLRGDFMRGLDTTYSIDGYRAMGSLELDQMQGHIHGIITSNSFGSASQPAAGSGTTNAPVYNAMNDPYTDGTNGTPRVGAETRPRNVATLICIKY